MAAVVYRSKVDAWLVVLLLFVWAFSLLTVMAGDPSVALWISMVVIVLMLVAMTDIVLRITYVITGNTLTVKCSFFMKKDFDIRKIKSISPSHSFLASAGASLDRLAIRFTDSREVLLISPKDKQGFINHICRVNPSVALLEK